MFRVFFIIGMLTAATLAKAESPSVASALALFNGASNQAEYRAALEQFEALQKSHPNDADISYYLGRSLFKDRQLKAADEVLSRNIKRHPKHVESHYVLGSVKLTRVAEVSLFSKIGMAKSALAAWQTAFDLDPDHVEALYGVVEFYYTAPGVAGGDEELGAQALTELEALSAPWADLSKASRAMKQASYDEAEGLFASAIDGIPNRAFPQLMLTNALIKQGKFQQAQGALDAYRLRDKTWNDPGTPQIELMAARIYQGLGQKDKAQQALDTVFASDPPPGLKEQAEKTQDELQAD